MSLVVATRMRPVKLRVVPAFLSASMVVAWQAEFTPGMRKGRIRAGLSGVFWTLTIWDDAASMTAFRDSGAHAKVAPKLMVWASEAAFCVWQTDAKRMPSWPEVSRRMAASPMLAPVHHPAAAQQRGEIRPARRFALALALRLPGHRRSRRAGAASVADQPGASLGDQHPHDGGLHDTADHRVA